MCVAGTFVDAGTDGPLLIAAAVADTAGLVSFLSPRVLPLVPGYLSFVTGLSGADLAEQQAAPRSAATSRPAGTLADAAPETACRTSRGRVLAGSTLFVAGFTAVFVTGGTLFGGDRWGADRAQGRHRQGPRGADRPAGFELPRSDPRTAARVSRPPASEGRPRRRPAARCRVRRRLDPCLKPTLGAVQTLAYTQASAGHGAVLTAAYCAGLGVPFIATGLAFRRALATFDRVRRHYRTVMNVGGALMIIVGLLLVSGIWEQLMIEVRVLVSGFTAPL